MCWLVFLRCSRDSSFMMNSLNDHNLMAERVAEARLSKAQLPQWSADHFMPLYVLGPHLHLFRLCRLLKMTFTDEAIQYQLYCL